MAGEASGHRGRGQQRRVSRVVPEIGEVTDAVLRVVP
jgi:hypothetical protein